MSPVAARPLALAVLLAAPLAALPTALAAQARPVSASAAQERLRRDIAYLASDRLEGRFTGSPGNDSAAAYIARRFAALKLTRVVESEACAGQRVTLRIDGARPVPARLAVDGRVQAESAGEVASGVAPACASYLQRFEARPAALAHAGRAGGLATQNVVATIPGTDPALRGQVVVLGAHYDHLGREKMFSTDPKAEDAIRNGADDNASGTAAVMELARRFAAKPGRRTVLVVAFSGEELGLLGSQWFVEHSPVPVDSIAAMLNFDMVGRLTNDRLLVYGTATATELPALLDSANAAGPRLQVKGIGDGFGPSDHSSFYTKNVPVLHFFTDQHADYHAATDDAARINVPGTARVVDLADAIARNLADRPARLTFQRAPTTQRMAGPQSSQGPRPYLGSIPDMSSDGVQGLRLQGITPGSPADKAGLKSGDVVVEMDSMPITDLYTYTDALYAHKPGDVVRVVVLRATTPGAPPERVTASVTLGQRGQ
ncbi:M20/M25/M40 family metallo-hydrolase [Roseisolibacter agri]|uniref:Aminopeptidase n=1 Tax=Roseisolibacter agri TaxID=2014610 RepID=A0AA37VC09_9BACT|nr:M20/M25/M40 family metallo-hydrolase [Roseisolibacter agri]GLC27148.1 aminopeptidase [Roseisolibacter agri]